MVTADLADKKNYLLMNQETKASRDDFTTKHGGRSGLEEPGAGVVEEPSKEKNKRRKIPKKAATEVSGLVQGISETEAQRVQKAFEDGREPSDWTRTRSSKSRKRGKRRRSPKEAAKEVSRPVRGILEGQRTAGKQAQAHSANPTPVPPRRKRLREESTCHVVEGGGKKVKGTKGGEVEHTSPPLKKVVRNPVQLEKSRP